MGADQSERLQGQFSFLNKSIHNNSNKYVFTKQEFINWWLEINNFIFIINTLES